MLVMFGARTRQDMQQTKRRYVSICDARAVEWPRPGTRARELAEHFVLPSRTRADAIRMRITWCHENCKRAALLLHTRDTNTHTLNGLNQFM